MRPAIGAYLSSLTNVWKRHDFKSEHIYWYVTIYKLTGPKYLNNIKLWIIHADILTLEYFIIAFQMQKCPVCQQTTGDRSVDRPREMV